MYNLGAYNRPEQDYDWILDETPTGEVERLVREHKHNRDLLKNLGSRYYQVVYPVQVRHKTMTGVSTRDTGDGDTDYDSFEDGRGIAGSSSINQPRVGFFSVSEAWQEIWSKVSFAKPIERERAKSVC